MDRRLMLKLSTVIGLGSIPSSTVFSFGNAEKHLEKSDRDYWVELICRIADPLLKNLSKGDLKKNMVMKVSPTYGDRPVDVGYLEAFGRLVAGMAPWLALPDDQTKEGELRARYRKLTLKGIERGSNPDSPDYFAWRSVSPQPLVDAAFLVQGLLRAPKILWDPLSEQTKNNLIEELVLLRRVTPFGNNWVLFAAIIETFLESVGLDADQQRIELALEKFDKEWYVGDGWYSDGPKFSFDHYNGYVIHCMLVEILNQRKARNEETMQMYKRAYKRMQRYGQHLERMISPEGYFLVIGRSSTYRNAAFQPLASLALDDRLPEDLSRGQVRAALTSVLKNIFKNITFDSSGWLALGFVGDKQEALADSYTNTGSLYMASLSFLPLGLPSAAGFWTEASQKWTSQKIWSGEIAPKDYKVDY